MSTGGFALLVVTSNVLYSVSQHELHIFVKQSNVICSKKKALGKSEAVQIRRLITNCHSLMILKTLWTSAYMQLSAYILGGGGVRAAFMVEHPSPSLRITFETHRAGSYHPPLNGYSSLVVSKYTASRQSRRVSKLPASTRSSALFSFKTSSNILPLRHKPTPR
jgi:hypothetical protein